MRAIVGSSAAATLLVAACLFPSLDHLEGSGDAGTEEDADSRARDSGGARDDAAAEADAGAEPQRIECGSETCTVGEELCCIGVIDVVGCLPVDQRSSCGIIDTPLFCDGDEDCPDGQVCCDQEEVRCQPSCPVPGTIVCTGSGRCPPGLACTRPLPFGHKACQPG